MGRVQRRMKKAAVRGLPLAAVFIFLCGIAGDSFSTRNTKGTMNKENAVVTRLFGNKNLVGGKSKTIASANIHSISQKKMNNTGKKE